MKIVTVSFDYASSDGRYKRLVDVFEFSARANGHEVVVLRPEAPPDTWKAHRFQTSNNYKLGLWIDTLKELEDDCVFCDCDLLCTGRLFDIWERDFDLAYTVRTREKVPVNAGVVFVRYTPKAIKFLEKWRKIDDAMYRDSEFRNRYAKKYCGQNQASFGFMLEQHSNDIAKITPVPCRIYNACDEDWPDIDGTERIIHCKSMLRDVIFMRAAPSRQPRYLRPCLTLWYEWERRMLDALAGDSKETTAK